MLFYSSEVPEIKVQHVQKIDLFTLRENRVGMYKVGQPYTRLVITFDLYYRDTIDKIEQIYNCIDSYSQPEILAVYYRFAEDENEYLFCQMKRDDMKWLFVEGTRLREKMTVVFQEAVKTADVAVPYGVHTTANYPTGAVVYKVFV